MPRISFASDYDISVEIDTSGNFIAGESNPYKVIVWNNQTSEDELNFSLERVIYDNGTVVSEKSGNYSLKRSLTRTYQWTPAYPREYALCAYIHAMNFNDTNSTNDVQCVNVNVSNAAYDNNNSVANFTCDLALNIDAEKFLYKSGDALGISINTTDLNHSGMEHKFGLEYWIEDLFGNIAKAPYENNYTINLTEVRKYNPHAPDIHDSEAYLIKANITETRCSDVNLTNNHHEKMILVKGVTPNSTLEQGDGSSLNITEIIPDATTFGDTVYVSLELVRGDTQKYSVSVRVERPSDGFDVSEKPTIHLKTKNTAYSIKVPVQLKPNCNGRYKDGVYEVIADGFGMTDRREIAIKGVSSALCKTETVTVKKYVTKTVQSADEAPASKSKYEFIIADFDEIVYQEIPFSVSVEVRNNMDEELNITLYSYVISGLSRLSEGLSDAGWVKSWTGNQREVIVRPKDAAVVNLTNRVMKNVTGNYTFKVKIKGDVNKALERMINISARIDGDHNISVSCNATDTKSYLFIENPGLYEARAVVSSFGIPRSENEIMINGGESRRMTYFGKVEKFVVAFDGGDVFECAPEYAVSEDVVADSITLKQTEAHMEGSFIERLVSQILLFFGIR